MLVSCVSFRLASALLSWLRARPVVSAGYATPAGNWKVERQTDRITGRRVSALLTANTGSNSAEPFAQLATLQLLCFMEKPVVRIGFDFKVGSSRNSSLGYRFDEKPGHEIGARFVQDTARW